MKISSDLKKQNIVGCIIKKKGDHFLLTFVIKHNYFQIILLTSAIIKDERLCGWGEVLKWNLICSLTQRCERAWVYSGHQWPPVFYIYYTLSAKSRQHGLKYLSSFSFSVHTTLQFEKKNWKRVDQGWNKTNCPSCLQWYPVYLIEHWRLHHFQSKEKQSGFPSRMWTQCGLHVLRIVSGRSQLLSHIQRRRRQTRKGSWRKWKWQKIKQYLKLCSFLMYESGF